MVHPFSVIQKIKIEKTCILRGGVCVERGCIEHTVCNIENAKRSYIQTVYVYDPTTVICAVMNNEAWVTI